MRGYTHNGTLYPFDVYDVENAERFEAALARVSASTSDAPLDGKLSDRMRWMLNVYRSFIDDVLGKGAAVGILGDCQNVKTAEAVCYEIIDVVKAQQKEYEAETRARRVNPSRRPKG